MNPESGLADQGGVLTPSVPRDIGARTQQQRIVEAMANSCAEKTFSTTTIADVVGRANISRATFYKHFANKRECLDAAVISFIEELEAAAVDGQSGAEARPAAIRGAIAAVLELLAAKPAYAKLVLLEIPVLDPAIIARHGELTVDGLKEQWEVGKGGKRAGADARIAFGRAHLLAADYLAADRADQLPELLPEIVYILCLPFIGHEAALEQVKLSR
jgi:AcrR family transcriptional regulator